MECFILLGGSLCFPVAIPSAKGSINKVPFLGEKTFLQISSKCLSGRGDLEQVGLPISLSLCDVEKMCCFLTVTL